MDLALNIAGTAIGALLGAAIHLLGGVSRWQTVRERWFIGHSAGGIALLVLWPVGLLFPGPVPFTFGAFWPRLRDALADWLADSAAAPWLEPWLQPDDSTVALSSGSEFMAIAMGLLAPCLVAYAVSRPGWRRIVLAAGAAATGLVAVTLSTALNFGPQHSLAWRTPPAEAALAAGFIVALLLAWVPRRAAAGVGLIVLAALAVFAGRCLLHRKPAGLGAGPLHPLPRRGAVDRVAVALRRDGLPAGPHRGAGFRVSRRKWHSRPACRATL